MDIKTIPEVSNGIKFIISMILICLTILAAVGLVSICRECSEAFKEKPLPYIAPDSEKAKMNFHGTEVSWDCDGGICFTRKPEDWEKKDKWIRL